MQTQLPATTQRTPPMPPVKPPISPELFELTRTVKTNLDSLHTIRNATLRQDVFRQTKLLVDEIGTKYSLT